MAPGTSSGRSIGTSTRSATRSRLRVVLPGTTLGSRFLVERLLASGAMGEVWQAVHGELRMRVALKTLRREIVADREIVARFSREAHLLSRVRSEHVVRVLDFFVDRRVGPVLVTEFVDGVPLSAMLAARRFTVEEAIELAIDLVTGLRELHRVHIVHRDVKPSNVLMRRTGEDGARAVFIDLGVSRLLRGEERSDEESLTEITTADRAVGTFEYMSPEQILDSRHVTESADLYAVGAILYRAVIGGHAFGSLQGVELLQRKLASAAPPLETGRSDRVALGFQELVRRALAMAPDHRYELADEMLADLSLLRDAARRAARTSPTASTIPPRAAPASRARVGRAIGVACLVVITLLGAAAGAFGVSQTRRPQATPPVPAAAAPVAQPRAPVCESPANERPGAEDGP